MSYESALSSLNSGMRCAKWMLIIVSGMFAITAMLLIMVGSTIQAIFGDFSQFIDSSFSSPPVLLIVVGFLMLAASILGAYGAVKESVMLINLYGLFLFVVFLVQIAAACVSFAMEGSISGMLLRTMNTAVSGYESNPHLRRGVDFMQRNLGCCGVFGPADWLDHLSSNANVSDPYEIHVPQTCCGAFEEVNNKLTCANKFESGCYNRLKFIVAQSTILIATGATTVAFVQLLGVICAFMLAKTLRRNKSIREARRWQLQQTLGVLIQGSKTPTAPVAGYTQLEKAETFSETEPNIYTANSPSVN